jgi:nucleotide-binding universal stress UspA family protein
MLIKRVIVAVDFSPPSNLAASYGIALARRFGARLTLLHVIEFPNQGAGKAERMLPALISPEDRDNLDIQCVVKQGDVQEQIKRAVEEQRADILVMGTHGRSLFKRLLIGSVAQSLLRDLPVPVFTLCHAGPQPGFERILLATDFCDVSDEAVQFALDLARTMGSQLIVAHVVDTRPGVMLEPPQVAAVFEEERGIAAEEARAKLKELEAEGASRGVAVETVLARGTPHDEILRIAGDATADFIVLQVRKRGLIDRMVLGSTAERVIRAAHVPVLCVPLGVTACKTEDERVYTTHVDRT